MPRVATSCEAEPREIARDLHHGRLVVVVDADERASRCSGSSCPAPKLRLGERRAERLGAAHHLARRLHLRPEDRVDAGEPHEREHRRLHEDAGHLQVLGQALLAPACGRP